MTQGTPPKGGRVGLRFNALHVNILFLSVSGVFLWKRIFMSRLCRAMVFQKKL